MESLAKIALGGGCYWCTEAIFLSLRGVRNVDQGFVSSVGEQSDWSEAVVIRYHPGEISLKDLIEVHLHTHKSTAAHRMRNKYRSAVYTIDAGDDEKVRLVLKELQDGFSEKLITEILPFVDFKPSEERYWNYYYSQPEKPFCETYIAPKLRLLLNRFSNLVDPKMVQASL
ncbi:peptide-methionine (S)-S-oxide reductase [Aggregatimonas sangjinii]|uniref:peptide-methionine (S)-S-oxide reductase n=1 Tax=Aggregatimonas sangjinii TaxID=2583587 RepID=A0A5B7SPN1_9FLAO|nr:peptide-methionine (S)-S-oxide reductase [Aggregatimonas sangjinii]QCX00477.1 peptide-methionine (S)-S-oxide reductase [Aggregatimonas sangjinii]